MLSWDATLSPGPCGPAKFWDFRCQKVKIFEKIARCARKEYTKRDRYQESALDNAKSEDPAKMTHSIPDFASRNAINTPIFIPILAVLAVNTTTPILAETRINTLCHPYVVMSHGKYAKAARITQHMISMTLGLETIAR